MEAEKEVRRTRWQGGGGDIDNGDDGNNGDSDGGDRDGGRSGGISRNKVSDDSDSDNSSDRSKRKKTSLPPPVLFQVGGGCIISFSFKLVCVVCQVVGSLGE
jgi:hypothetical protein